MIELELAQKFIEKVIHYTNYNVNIMDENGIIIASRDPARVGTYHEIAHMIAQGGDEIVETAADDEYEGTRRGVNMAVVVDGRREGVIGLTGDPAEICSVALVLKMSIETMLTYESRMLHTLRRQNKKERFAELLTEHAGADEEELRRLAEELGYQERFRRIPVLLKTNAQEGQKLLLDSVRNSPQHGTEDISFTLGREYVLIFKTLGDEAQSLKEYQFAIADYLSATLRLFRQENYPLSIYIGSIQNRFSHYHAAYAHCRWLEENCPEPGSHWFYEHVGSYLAERIPFCELSDSFGAEAEGLDEKFRRDYIEVMGALFESGYNLAEAAKRMYLHKNTFAYRYNKIRERLALNPQTCPEDRHFAEALYVYLKRMSAE